MRTHAVGRAAAAPALVAVAAGAGVGVVGVVDPNQPGHYPTCPFLLVTGLQCPGCGSLRAIHALTRGDVGSAVGLNALAIAALVLLTVIWVRWLRARLAGYERARLAPAGRIRALLAVVVIFGVLRNLPIGAALAA